MYGLKCSCCNIIYYGESVRHFFIRASEHLGNDTLIGKGVNTTKKSAATHHIQLKGHDARLCDSLEKKQ